MIPPDTTEKAREFWIKACVAFDKKEMAEQHYKGEKRYDMENAPIIHVIEYSAYAERERECERLRELLALALPLLHAFDGPAWKSVAEEIEGELNGN